MIPLVHWLPKNRLRKWLIHLFYHLGIGPKDLKTHPLEEKITHDYDYMLTQTFYRNWKQLEQTFGSLGLETCFTSGRHPKVCRHPVFRATKKMMPLKQFLNWSLLNFMTIELMISKSNEKAAKGG